VGVNVTVKEQLAAGASCAGSVPQVLVWAKSPVIAMAVIFKVADPVFVSVTVWGGLVTPTVSFGKVRLEAESVPTGA
jgi:hypothetical protein